MRWERLRRRILELLRFELLRPVALAAVGASLLGACSGALNPQAKLGDAVQEMNDAARFGRGDIAAEHVAPSARPEYLKRHRAWGGDVRIVEVEYGGIEKLTDREAIILVGFGWYRPSEGVLRTTTVRQTWRNDKGSGPWFLHDEERVDGDVGLLGETTKVVTPERKNVQFETTVIR